MLPEDPLHQQRYGALLLGSRFLVPGNRAAIRENVGVGSDV